MSQSSRPKLVLDIALLGDAHDGRFAARGVHRVAQYIFKTLQESGNYDLRFVATSHLAGAYDFLKSQGIQPENTMGFSSFQLALSRLGRSAAKWVHGNIKDRRLPARAARYLLSVFAKLACSQEKRILPKYIEGADIYHSPLAPIPPAVRANKKIKHFLTVHDLIPLVNPQSLDGDAGPYIKRLLGSIGEDSYAFCVTETVKSDLLRFSNLRAERIFVTYLAADREIFNEDIDASEAAAIRKSYGIPDCPYFLSLSSIDPRKNFGHIVECFSRLVESGEIGDSNLLIVGSNPTRNKFLENAISKHPKIKDRIITPGYIPDNHLAAVYSGALAFVFPSLAEGFGIPPLEAMQCGTPVISSNATVIPEVLGDAAILLDPHDVDGWCKAIISVTCNPSLREELKQKGLKHAETYSWQRFADATFAGYSAALRQEV